MIQAGELDLLLHSEELRDAVISIREALPVVGIRDTVRGELSLRVDWEVPVVL